MTLEEYIKSDDSNLFWRLSSGEHQNLLDEAIEKIEQLEFENKAIIGNASVISEELSRVKKRLDELETFEHEGKFYVDKKDTDTIFPEEVIE